MIKTFNEVPSDYVPGAGELRALFSTNLGEIEAKLFEHESPKTVANFVGLATGLRTWTDPETFDPRNTPFYDGVIFHRVIPGFMIQGGDRLGLGTGGPGYRFADEFNPTLRHNRKGLLSMANAGPNTNGSQFFITEGPTPHLDGKHAIFGEVIRGSEAVHAIANAPLGPRDRPKQDVIIQKLTIFRA